MLEWIIAHRIWIILTIIIIFIRFEWKNQAITPPEHSEYYKEIVTMDFDQVKNIYLLNPDRLRYQKLEKDPEHKYLLMYISDPVAWTQTKYSAFYDRYENFPCPSNCVVAIAMRPGEAIKFNRARKKKPNNVKTEETILKIMQKDIDRLREKSQKEVDQAREITERIARSMNNHA